jgi:hypothetical protein
MSQENAGLRRCRGPLAGFGGNGVEARRPLCPEVVLGLVEVSPLEVRGPSGIGGCGKSGRNQSLRCGAGDRPHQNNCGRLELEAGGKRAPDGNRDRPFTERDD